jgi:hypothetical protein
VNIPVVSIHINTLTPEMGIFSVRSSWVASGMARCVLRGFHFRAPKNPKI